MKIIDVKLQVGMYRISIWPDMRPLFLLSGSVSVINIDWSRILQTDN